MNILMILTSNDRLGASDKKPDSGSKNSLHLIMFSRMREPTSHWSPRSAASRRSIPKAMARTFRRKTPAASARIERLR